MEKSITNGEILPINKLRTLLIETVKICNDDAENITNRQLKRWLQRDYPHLTFIKPRQCNLSELVLYNTSNKYVMIDQPEADSTSTETTEAEYNAECSGAWYAREEKANLYKSALFLRNIISESPLLDCSWPPTANDLAETAALKMVPTLLFNFLAWCTGETDSFDPDDIAQVSAQCQKKILCIAQDIIYLSSKGKKQTPKHLSLAMAIRHITGSSKVIQILNGLGHCISHTSTLEFDTALAELQLQSSNSIPAGIRLGIFTTITWDNIDFQEETLTGHNTTHNTNGIIVQRSDGNELTQISKNNKKSKRRTINPPITSISECFFGKKCGPLSQFAITDCQTTELIAGSGAKEIDLAYILCKLPEFNNEILPGWTGFNTKIQAADSIPLSTIRYLPVVEANPTQFSTVHTLLLKSIEIADQLELEQLVVVFDQAIYAKAQQIRWKNDIFQNRLVVRLGEFHVILSFLGILGKRYKDAGLSNIMIESGIVAEGSVSGVMSGKHYNRSIRAHKIIYEALYRLLWTSFLEGVSNEEFIEIQGIVKEIHKSYDMEYLDETVLPPSFNNVMQRFEKFIDERCKANVTFAFWVSYLDMIGCLLQFIRATRIGNWVLHLASLTHMVPWYFAYDRINYARYLPVYLLEMLNLNETHSFIYLKMLNGEFVVQQQNKYGFSGTAFDQVIEQTANKDSKTKGGLVGVTKNSNATHRWLLSHHLRAQISINCLQLAGKNSKQRNRIHLDQARMKIDELSVCNVVSVISSMINPLEWEDNILVNISSGFVASNEIQKDLERARSVGIAAYKDFKETCLLIKNEKLDIFSPIKLQKLKTFSDLSSSSIPKHKLPDSTINTNKLLAQIVVIGQSTKLDMREIMSYSLTPFPLSISNSDGSLVKTSKAALVHHLLNSIKPQDLSSNCIPEDHKILIIDGMMLIQQMKAIPETFGALASQLLQNVIQKAISHGAHRVDFVTDSYPTISVKNNERERRANCNSTSIKIVNSQQKTPRQFKNFLSNGENKQALIEFLYEEWSCLKPISLKNINLIIAHGNMCHSFNVTHDKLVITEVPELYCDHEEADTRILLHAAHSSRRVKNVIIWSKDTDVFLISLFACSLLDVKIYMTVNTTSQYQLVNVSNIARMLGDDICAALIGLHVFTGCDSTSAFKGKGKEKDKLTEKLGAVIKNKENEMDSSLKEKEALKMEFDEMKCDYDSKIMMSETQLKAAEDQLAEKDKRTEKLGAVIKNKENEMDSSLKEKEALKMEFDEMKCDHDSKVMMSETQLNAAEEPLSLLFKHYILNVDKVIGTLEALLKNKENQLASSLKEREALKMEFDEMICQFARTAMMIETKLKATEDQLAEKDKLTEKLGAVIKNKENEMDSSLKEKEALKMEFDEMKCDHDSKVMMSETQLKAAEDQLTNADKVIEKLEAIVKNKENKLAASLKEREALKMEFDEMKCQYASNAMMIETKLKATEDQLAEKDKLTEKLGAVIKNKENEMDSSLKEKEALKMEFDEMKCDHDSKVMMSETQLKAAEDQLANADKVIEKLEAIVKNKENKLAASLKEREALKMEFDEMKCQYASNAMMIETKLKATEDQLAVTSEKLNFTEGLLVETKTENESLLEEVITLKTALNADQQPEASVEVEKKSLKEQLVAKTMDKETSQTLLQEKQKYEIHIGKLNAKIEQLQMEAGIKSDDEQDLKHKLEVTSEKLNFTEGLLVETKTEKESLLEEVITLKTALNADQQPEASVEAATDEQLTENVENESADENQEIQDLLDEKDEQIEKLTEELIISKELQYKVFDKLQRLEQLIDEEEFEKVKNTLMLREGSIDMMAAEIRTLKFRLSQKEQELVDFNEVVRRYKEERRKIKQLLKVNENFKKKLKFLEMTYTNTQNIGKMQDQIQFLTHERNRDRASLDYWEEKVQMAAVEIDHHKMDLTRLRQLIRMVRIKITLLSGQPDASEFLEIQTDIRKRAENAENNVKEDEYYPLVKPNYDFSFLRDFDPPKYSHKSMQTMSVIIREIPEIDVPGLSGVKPPWEKILYGKTPAMRFHRDRIEQQEDLERRKKLPPGDPDRFVPLKRKLSQLPRRYVAALSSSSSSSDEECHSSCRESLAKKRKKVLA